MQTFPDPPKSYSLIKNLLPSVSLVGETSNIEEIETNFIPDPQISSQVDTLIHAVQNSSLNDLKSTLKTQLIELQVLSNPKQPDSSEFRNESFPSDDLIIEKLKQLKLITEVMAQRMNQKYKQAQSSFKQLDKTMKQKNQKIGVRSFFYWKRSNKQQKKQNASKINQSQSTQKKAVIVNAEDQEKIIESDRKKTRKQDEKEKSLRMLSK